MSKLDNTVKVEFSEGFTFEMDGVRDEYKEAHISVAVKREGGKIKVQVHQSDGCFPSRGCISRMPPEGWDKLRRIVDNLVSRAENYRD